MQASTNTNTSNTNAIEQPLPPIPNNLEDINAVLTSNNI